MSLTLPALQLSERPAFADQLRALKRRWRVIAACAALGPGAGFLALAQMQPRYTATGILLYDPSGAAIPGDAASQTPDEGLDEDAVTASQGAIIASLPASGQIAAQLGLAASPEFNPALKSGGFPFSLLPGRQASDADEVAQEVSRRLSVTIMPGSRVISVSFTSASPQLAADAANLAMRLYLDHERDESFAALTAAQSWLEDHSASVQADLDHTETQLAEARAAAGVVQGSQASLTDETASHLADELVQAQADLAMNQARIAASGGDEAAANAAIAPNLAPLRKEQADLRAEVAALAQSYGPDYPPLSEARTQLAAIEAEINDETGRQVSADKAQVAADAAQIATLRQALAAARTQAQTEDEESAPIRALEQRADAGRDMLRAMTLQADQLAQDASLTRPDARILSDAAVPESPSAPRRRLILAASGGLGLCLGVLLAGLLDALDSSLRSGAAVRARFGLPCHALVPEVAVPHAAALSQPFSLYAEQLRALRTGLGLGQGACRIAAITAARPDEGKTTLCVALARQLAASGLRVLAIDGDIRRPGFPASFGGARALGLTDHLAGLAPLSACLSGDPLTPLAVLHAGRRADAALSVFLSPALPEFLEGQRKNYDVILIDAPPAFALAEGRVLARAADAVLLCIRWGHTPDRVVRAAMLLLREAGAALAGAALTRVDAAAHRRSGFEDAEFYSPLYAGYYHSRND